MRGGRKAQKGGDICVHIADSLYCTAETNTALYINYTPIKKVLRKLKKKLLVKDKYKSKVFSPQILVEKALAIDIGAGILISTVLF